jgi:PAS domain S-box-containing protein
MNERPGQYVGVPLTEYFHTNDPEFLPLVAHRRALLGESVAFEVEWLGRTFAAHVEPMRTPEGAIAGVIGAALDVTRQKQAEGELRKSVALLQATLDAAADGVLVVDHEGKVISANRRFREMWRIPDEIAEANDPRRLLAHVAEQLKDQTGFLKKVLGVSATRDDEPPALLDLTDGRLFERTSRPHAVGGETLGRVWTFRDVTARHEIERELEQSLALLKATLDATADGVLVVDSAGRVVSFNRRFLEMWRIPEPLARSRDDNQLLAFVLDQLKDPDRFVKKVRELYGRPDAQSYDWLEFEDGRVFERYSTPHEVGGKVVGRVWSFRDVSDRARMENVLRRDARTFEHLFDAVVVMDLTAKVLDCNPGAERLFGSAREDIVGKNLPVEEIAPRALGPEQRLAEMRRLGRWSGEIAFRRRDGTEGLCETVVVPLWDDFGRTVGALQISRDVNGRTKREAPPAG